MRKISPPTGIQSPDRPTGSESLYGLSYPGPQWTLETTLITLRLINCKECGNTQIWRYSSGNVICVSWFWFYITNGFTVGFVNPPKQKAKCGQLQRPVSELIYNDFLLLKTTKINLLFFRSVSSIYETRYVCPLYRRSSLTFDQTSLQTSYRVTIMSGRCNLAFL